MNASPANSSFDLVVVGSGPLAAVAVREYLDARPAAKVAVLDAGPVLTPRPAEHLIATNPARLDETYEQLMRAAHRIAGQAPLAPSTAPKVTLDGLVPAADVGHDMTQFPGAVTAWNVGGMGVHWTAACPVPAGTELVPGITPQNWTEQLHTAQQHLQVADDGYADNPFAQPIMAALAQALPSPEPGRALQPMPMAGTRLTSPSARRTGPLDVLPELHPTHPNAVTLLDGTLCTRVLFDGDQVRGVLVRPLGRASEQEIIARVVLVAADALRTPQLLWASGLGGPAIGRYLNEHACVSVRVRVDPARLGMSGEPPPTARAGEPFVGAYWYPSQESSQLIHLQLMETSDADGHRLRISAYAPTEIQTTNRLQFQADHLDDSGMPRIRAHFTRTARDLTMIEAARALLRTAADAISSSEGGAGQVALAGSSLHYTGTARIGPQGNDAVCDTTGRVWGTTNLFLVGNATVPTALTCNSTLTSAALAIGAGRAAALV